MKNLFTLLCFAFLIGSFSNLSAQESENNYEKRNPIYDYSEKQLNNTDTIPGYEAITDKLKITGIVYQSDGVTPAENVLLYIEHVSFPQDSFLKMCAHQCSTAR